jgi:3-methyladenine DNA glycosylase AlkD
MLKELKKELEKNSSEISKKNYEKFFNSSYTSKKDFFLGVKLSFQREIAKKYLSLSFSQVERLLNSEIHEERMVAGIILTNKFKDSPKEVFNFYLKNLKKFYNWDLVDTTSQKIVGKFLLENKKERKILYTLIKSKNLWERRIAMVSTLEFIKNNEFGEALKLSEILIKDSHHLSHKAVGWMLREIGKRNEKVLLDFLRLNYRKLPRTTLRSAIEKFNENKRKEILNGKFN